MMFKCCECGHLFEEGEQAVWYENQGECHGVTAMEKFSGCPLCHNGYEEVHQCKECGDWHSENEMYEGFCEKCLIKAIDYDSFLQYCDDQNTKHLLTDFVLLWIYDMDAIRHPSDKFNVAMRQVYLTLMEKAKKPFDIFAKKEAEKLLWQITEFIKDDLYDWAYWLNRKEAR